MRTFVPPDSVLLRLKIQCNLHDTLRETHGNIFLPTDYCPASGQIYVTETGNELVIFWIWECYRIWVFGRCYNPGKIEVLMAVKTSMLLLWVAVPCGLVAIQTWRRRQYVSWKRWCLPTGLHGLTAQQTNIGSIEMCLRGCWMCWCEVDGTGSESYSLPGFGIDDVETSGSAAI
jgi:hypothetical protein